MSNPFGERLKRLEDIVLAVQRTTLGSSFTKAIRVLVIPTGKTTGRHILLDGGSTTASAFIAIFNATTEIRTLIDEAGVFVQNDYQIGESRAVRMTTGGTDNPGRPQVELKPGPSAGGNWTPSELYSVNVANAGAASEQAYGIWAAPIAKPDNDGTTPPSIELWSLSRDGVTHGEEINMLTETFAIYDLTRANVFATFRAGNSGGSPKLRLESTQALAGNRMIDLLKSGDSHPGWTIDGDGKQQWGPGGGTPVDVNLYRSAADILATDNNFSIKGSGKGLRIFEGANARMGTAVLVAGTVVVNTNKVTANSRIFLTSNADGGTNGFVRVSARTAGTSFTITSSNAADTSTIAWVMFEPA